MNSKRKVVVAIGATACLIGLIGLIYQSLLILLIAGIVASIGSIIGLTEK